MNQPKKKKKIVWQQYIGTAFSLLCGAICGYVMVMFIDNFSDDIVQHIETLSLVGFCLRMYVAFYVAFFFHTLTHEAGHLLFGLMTGYKFSSFRVASFMWLKENGKLKLKRVRVAGTGGQCLMVPPDVKDGKIPFVLYNLGGSFINLVLGVLFLVGYLLCSDVPFFSLLLLNFSVVGFMIAMMNGIPMRIGTDNNDGYNVFALSRNKEAVEAFWVQLKVVEQSSKGIRIKDMPAEWFTVPTDEAMKNSMVATRGVFACNRLMDEEKFEEADALMAHLLEIDSGIVGLHHHLLMCDRIYVELIGENRSEVIESMITEAQKKFMKSMKRFPSVLRTQYALALLSEKNTVKAEAIMNDFEKAAKSYPYTREIDSERDLLRLAENKFASQK